MIFLGILSALFQGTALLTDALRDANADGEAKQDAIRSGCNTWTDNNGNCRLVGTNEKCYYADGKLRAAKDNRVIVDCIDISIKNSNNQSISEAKENGKKYACLLYREFLPYGEKGIGRYYYTELDTGRRYYLKKYGYNPTKYQKGYYTQGKSRISTNSTEWEDEIVNITEEEYVEWGGWPGSCNDKTGVYYT